MNKNSFFDFEDKIDFPFYKKSLNQKRDLLILLSSTIIFTFLILGPIKFYKGQEQIILFLFTFLMLLLFTKGNLSTFLRKPTIDNIKLVIICFILYEFYYLGIYFLFGFIGFQTSPAQDIYLNNFNILIFLCYVLQVIAEEIFKILLFILILHFVYKKTSNRKKSIILSSIIVMLVFGLLHINTFGNIIQILFIQGLGSIFQLYGYLKTKNILIPIFVHLLINCSSWIPLLLGIH